MIFSVDTLRNLGVSPANLVLMEPLVKDGSIGIVAESLRSVPRLDLINLALALLVGDKRTSVITEVRNTAETFQRQANQHGATWESENRQAYYSIQIGAFCSALGRNAVPDSSKVSKPPAIVTRLIELGRIHSIEIKPKPHGSDETETHCTIRGATKHCDGFWSSYEPYLLVQVGYDWIATVRPEYVEAYRKWVEWLAANGARYQQYLTLKSEFES